MSDIGEIDIETRSVQEKPKQKKTPEQLANLAKGREKRNENLRLQKLEEKLK